MPNLWDVVAILCVVGALVGIAHVAHGTLAPIDAPGATEISLDPARLPEYAVRTTLRMFAALLLSLVFTFAYGTAAAKSRRAGVILVPILVPPAMTLGIDPIQFGLVFTLGLMIGVLTPPVGSVLFVTARVAGISFERVSRATLPFLWPLIVVLVMIAAYPPLTTWLPQLLMGR